VDFGYEVSRALNPVKAPCWWWLPPRVWKPRPGEPVFGSGRRPGHHPGHQQDRPGDGPPDEVAEDIGSLLGVLPRNVLRVSAKDGKNVAAVLEPSCKDPAAGRWGRSAPKGR